MAVETFYCAIKPLLVISKILGLVPFKFNEHGYLISKGHISFMILVAILYAALVVYVIYVRIQVVTTTVLTTTTDILQISTAAIQIVVVWISSIYFQKQHIKLLNKLEKIGKKLQALGVWICYDREKKIIYIQILVRIVVFVTSVIIQAIVFDFGESFITTLLELAFYFPIIINCGVCQQVSIYITAVKKNYKILNRHLHELQQYSDKPVPRTRGPKIIKFLQTKMSLLRTISPLHHELSKIVYIINKTFGIPLLATFGVTFIVTIVDFYYCIVMVQDLDKTMVRMFVATVCNCAPYIMDAVFMCYLCNSTSEEANLSGTLIHELETEDKEVKNQIDIFSLQLAHEKIEINAGGFFPVNYTLLFSFFGGVTTNLVILIQFSTSSS